MKLQTTIGIDLGKKTKHRAATASLGQSLSSIRTRTVHTSRQSLDEIVDEAGDEPCDVVLEPTGMTWLLISAYLLLVRGCRVFRVDTRRVSEFRKVIRRDAKSDSIDAVAMARLPAANPDGLEPLALPSAAQFALDRTCRQRAQIVEDKTRVLLRLEAAVETYVPGLFDVMRPLGPGERVVLRSFLDPARMFQAGHEGLARVAREAGCLNPDKLACRILEAARGPASLWQALREASCCPVDFDEAQREIAKYLDILEDHEGHICKLDTHIQQLSRKLDPNRVLETIPGVGPVVSATLLAAFWNIERFQNARKFVAYCGLVPRKNQTGQTDREGQRITKAGKKLIRHHLYLAADVARQYDLQLAHFYQRKRAENKHHVEATVAVAAALARRVYSVLKRAKSSHSQGYVRKDDTGVEQTGREARAAIRARYPKPATPETPVLGARRDTKNWAVQGRPSESAAGYPPSSQPDLRTVATTPEIP